MNRLAGYLLAFVVRAYQAVLSPMIPAYCRFHPTCSQYSIDAFHKYGLIKGLALTFKRIMRCHPGNPGGYDPVE
jgi:hypothetical protein